MNSLSQLSLLIARSFLILTHFHKKFMRWFLRRKRQHCSTSMHQVFILAGAVWAFYWGKGPGTGGWEYGMSSRRRSISVRWTQMDVINSATRLPIRIRSAGWSPLRWNPLCAVRDGRLYYDPQLRPVVDPAAAALLAYLLSISCKPSLRQSQSGRPWTWIPAFAW